VAGEPAWLLWTGTVVVLIAVVVGWWIWTKGRPFADGDVFRASRLSAGNHLFPTQVQVTPTSVVQYKPRWVGRREETIHMAHIASVKIDTGMLLSDVLKQDAVQMKNLIERYQTDYFQGHSPVGAPRPGR
jgi:hypothetical protein